MGTGGTVFPRNESPGSAEVPEECDFTLLVEVSHHAAAERW